MQRPIDIAVLEAYRLGCQSMQDDGEKRMDVDNDGVALLAPDKIENRKRHLVHLFGHPMEHAFSIGRQESQTK